MAVQICTSILFERDYLVRLMMEKATFATEFGRACSHVCLINDVCQVWAHL